MPPKIVTNIYEEIKKNATKYMKKLKKTQQIKSAKKFSSHLEFMYFNIKAMLWLNVYFTFRGNIYANIRKM